MLCLLMLIQLSPESDKLITWFILDFIYWSICNIQCVSRKLTSEETNPIDRVEHTHILSRYALNRNCNFSKLSSTTIYSLPFDFEVPFHGVWWRIGRNPSKIWDASNSFFMSLVSAFWTLTKQTTPCLKHVCLINDFLKCWYLMWRQMFLNTLNTHDGNPCVWFVQWFT